MEKAKGEADWVMVVVHWSDELFPYPRPEDRATARELAQMGADLVVGHHPHVVRGMEIIWRLSGFLQHREFLLLRYRRWPWWLDCARGA